MPDREIEVNGGIVVYEFVGPEDGEVVVITPGGRFSKDFGGIHELADALAAGGKRVSALGSSQLRQVRRAVLRSLRVPHAGRDAGLDGAAARYRAGRRGGRIGRRSGLDHLHDDVAGSRAQARGVAHRRRHVQLVGARQRLRHDRARHGPAKRHRGDPGAGRPRRWVDRPHRRQPAEPGADPRRRHRGVRTGDEPVAGCVHPEAERVHPRRARLRVRHDHVPDVGHPWVARRTTTTRSARRTRCTR